MLHRHASPAVAGSYTVGAVSGALLSGSALLLISGLISPIPASVRATIALLALVMLLLRVTNILCLDLPQRRVQIPRESFGPAPTRSAFRFAFELGTGVRTYITATAPYALAVIITCCLPQSLGAATTSVALAAIGYGLGRSLVVASQSVRKKISVDAPTVWLRVADIVAVTTAFAIAVSFALSLS